mgnify:CR=1 FL=1
MREGRDTRTDFLLQLLFRFVVALLELVGELAQRLELVDIGFEDLVVLRDRLRGSASRLGLHASMEAETHVVQLHVAFSKLLEHVLRLGCDVELGLEVLDLGLGLLELDGHIVEVSCSGRPSSVLVGMTRIDQSGRCERTLQVGRQVQLLLHRLDLALELCLALGRQVAQPATHDAQSVEVTPPRREESSERTARGRP